MIYFDEEYKVDCANKFDYQNLKKMTEDEQSVYNDRLINVVSVYKSNNPDNSVLLVIGEEDFYTKNVYFCKAIAQNMYKVIIDKPAEKSLQTLKRTYNKQIKTKHI